VEWILSSEGEELLHSPTQAEQEPAYPAPPCRQGVLARNLLDDLPIQPIGKSYTIYQRDPLSR